MLFLDDGDLAHLTGRKRKAQQVEALRRMGIPFWVNAAGKPVVAKSAIEGGKQTAQSDKPAWQPAVLRRAA